MKIYLVGGAVRDQLLNISPKEKDWVVVGANQHDMLQKGFRQVGKDFPVYLHPKTKEEYALARKERKIGKGYTGFAFDSTPDVTLEEDLLRRDLTINAMAKAEDGTLIDPFNGQSDLNNKILRHVSPAFAEDPVRILRTARFAARFGFTVAPETLELMRSMVKAGEVDALVSERVWKELERALVEPQPKLFFSTLCECGALDILFPGIELNGKGMNLLLHIDEPVVRLRFAALAHDLNPKTIMSLNERYKIPNEVRDLALLVNKYLPDFQKAQTLNDEELVNLFQHLDAFRREQRFYDFLNVGRVLNRNSSNYLQKAYAIVKNIDVKEVTKHYQGKAIAIEIYHLRCKALKKWFNDSESNLQGHV